MFGRMKQMKTDFGNKKELEYLPDILLHSV